MYIFWTVLFLLCGAILVTFSFVILFGAPFLPTLSKNVEPALDLLNLDEGRTLIELGCGDGRVLKAAAKRGIYSVGYELNPLLVLASKVNCWQYRKYVTVIWGNYWHKTWPEAQAIFTFLLNPYMPKLDKAIQDYSYKPLKVVSFAFEIPNKKPLKHKSGLFLYVYK